MSPCQHLRRNCPHVSDLEPVTLVRLSSPPTDDYRKSVACSTLSNCEYQQKPVSPETAGSHLVRHRINDVNLTTRKTDECRFVGTKQSQGLELYPTCSRTSALSLHSDFPGLLLRNTPVKGHIALENTVKLPNIQTYNVKEHQNTPTTEFRRPNCVSQLHPTYVKRSDIRIAESNSTNQEAPNGRCNHKPEVVLTCVRCRGNSEKPEDAEHPQIFYRPHQNTPILPGKQLFHDCHLKRPARTGPPLF